MPTELVLPDSISCLCLNKLSLVLPLPSSRLPRVRQPRVVLFPASTFPAQATRTSVISSIEAGTRRTRM
jgi:hypothetical protein